MAQLLNIDRVVTDADSRTARTRWKSAWKEAYIPGKAKTKWREAHDEAPVVSLVGEGVWERILRGRGAVVREDGRKLVIRCPNEARHTSHSDTGTVLYRPNEGDIYGHIHCSHTHCAELDFRTLITENEWVQAVDYVKAFLVQKVSEAPIVCTLESNEEADAKLLHDLIRDVKESDNPAGIAANVSTILHGHSFWKGRLAYDTFKHVQVWDNVPPELQLSHKWDQCVLGVDYSYIQGWLLRGDPRVERPKLSANIDAIKAGVTGACALNSIDTLERHVLASKGKWDGVPRLHTWLTTYLGCEDTPLTRAIGGRWLLAMIARALKPGVVADMMPILQGSQGVGKGYCLKILFGSEYVVTTGTYKVGSKDFEQRIADAWCAHDDELVSSSKAGLELTKSWLTDTWAKFRKAYSTDFVSVQRRFLVVGSCNHEKFLEDEENRRFWPIRIRKLDDDALIRDRDQLIGEAVFYHELGHEHRIRPTDTVWEALSASHESAKVEDLYQQKIEALLTRSALQTPFQLFQLFDLLGFRPDQYADKYLQRRIGASLRAMGFRSRQVRVGKMRHWMWERMPGGDFDVRTPN